MITGKKKLLDWYRSQADTYPYWFISKTTDKQDYIFTCKNVENYSPEAGASDLSHAIGLLNSDSRYFICLRDRYDQNNKAHMRSIFFDSDNRENVEQSKEVAIHGIERTDFDQRVSEKVSEQLSVFKKEFQNEQKIKELENQIVELKKEKNERPDYIGSIIETYGKDILEAFKNGTNKPRLATVSVSGFDNNKQKDMNANEQEEFEKLMEAWEKGDPEYLKVISKIVKLLQTNPKKYRMAKTML